MSTIFVLYIDTDISYHISPDMSSICIEHTSHTTWYIKNHDVHISLHPLNDNRRTDLPTDLRRAFPVNRRILLYGEKVKDGRWAYTEIPLARKDVEADVYGKLRAPWSTSDKA